MENAVRAGRRADELEHRELRVLVDVHLHRVRARARDSTCDRITALASFVGQVGLLFRPYQRRERIAIFGMVALARRVKFRVPLTKAAAHRCVAVITRDRVECLACRLVVGSALLRELGAGLRLELRNVLGADAGWRVATGLEHRDACLGLVVSTSISVILIEVVDDRLAIRHACCERAHGCHEYRRAQ
jgi:hypothetical protein